MLTKPLPFGLTLVSRSPAVRWASTPAFIVAERSGMSFTSSPRWQLAVRMLLAYLTSLRISDLTGPCGPCVAG